MSVFQPHWNVLPASQRELWPLLAPSVSAGFVLYGGTAAALRLGHRTSVDFDFFTERPLDVESLRQSFSFLAQSKTIQDQKNTLSVLVPVQGTNVKVSFFGEIGIGRVGAPDLTQDGVMRVASLLDILATKLKVLLQRVEAKDYRDIASILRAGARLDAGLGAATSMFNPNFQPSEAIKALTYFKGGDLGSIPSTDRELLVRAVEKIRHIPPVGIISRSLS